MRALRMTPPHTHRHAGRVEWHESAPGVERGRCVERVTERTETVSANMGAQGRSEGCFKVALPPPPADISFADRLRPKGRAGEGWRLLVVKSSISRMISNANG